MSDVLSSEGRSPGSLRGWRVAALPVLVSLALSAATVGNRAHWQDSGLFLTAIREYSVLYPPGFVLYQTLCKAWTLLFGFLDFVLAVHLFSSLCAALAAGLLARAAEQVTKDGTASAVAGCLAAAGYTWWFSGLYAKGYAFLFLLVALLLWRMVLRDHRAVAILPGLAWSAHPSAALLAPVVLLYIVRHWAEIRALGWLRIAGLAAAGLLGAFGPALLLPLLAARDSIYSMGHPVTVGEWLRYETGARFTGADGVWGYTGWRWAHAARYAWEEFLGVGAALAALGIYRLCRDRREERWALAVWVVPVVAGATLFRIEGQFDFWMVTAWMPLWIAAALGLSALREKQRHLPAAALGIGLAWAVLANGRDLYLRGDDGPELLGRSLLEPLDPGATLVVTSDDGMGLCSYLQTVRGVRKDVRVVQASQLSPVPELTWYRDRLSRHWPEWTPPDFSLVLVQASTYTPLALTQAAIVQGRKPGAPPVYFDQQPPAGLMGSGAVVPAGFLWKWSERADTVPDPKEWKYPVTLEEAASRRGRKRGISAGGGNDPRGVLPQAYEDRLIYYMAVARRNLGELAQREGTRAGYERSAECYESILRLAPELGWDPQLLYALGLDDYLLDRREAAAAMFERALELDPRPQVKAGSLFYLGELHAAGGRRERALDFYRRAREVVPPESPLRAELDRRLGR